MHARTSLLGALVTAALLAPAHAEPPRGPDHAVTIAVALPNIEWMDVPQRILEAAQMAVDKQGGKVCGDWAVSVELHAHGSPRSGWDANRLRAQALREIADPRVGAILGPYNSGAAATLLPIVNASGLLVVSPSNTASCLTTRVEGVDCDPEAFYPTGVRNYARVISHDVVQGTAQARLAALLGTRVYVEQLPNEYADVLRISFTDAADGLGLAIVGTGAHDFFPEDAAAAEPIAARIIASAPEVVVLEGFEEAIAITLALRTAGYAGAIIASDGAFSPGWAELVGADAGVYVTIAGAPLAELGADAVAWGAEFTELHGAPDLYTVLGYAAAQHILAAMESACAGGHTPTDRAAVRDAGLAPGPRHSVLGEYAIDANGDITPGAITAFGLASGELLPTLTLR